MGMLVITLLSTLSLSANALAVTPARSSPAQLRPRLPQLARATILRMQKGDDAELVERAAAAAVYLFPAFDGFQYGAYVYKTIPPIGAIAYNLVPAVNAFQSLPFAGFILFIGLSYFSRNANLSRFVRFNIQQALLLDIVLIIPGFVGNAAQMFPVDLQTRA